jgi:hypothetical protein
MIALHRRWHAFALTAARASHGALANAADSMACVATAHAGEVAPTLRQATRCEGT